MMSHWFVLPVNPEPWAIGSLGIGRRNGKMFPQIGPNLQLVSFKEAIRSELLNVAKLPPGEYELRLFFWRRLDDYETQSGRRHRKHIADATNLQKATEDALQDVLIDNDRNVRKISSEVVEQGASVTPRVVVYAKMWEEFDPSQIPDNVWEMFEKTEQYELPVDNSWPPTGGV